MKKIFVIVLAVAVSFLLTDMAMAAGAKVPKALCLTGGGAYFSIVTKASGSMKISGNETVKFYDLQGNWVTPAITSGPIDGSGYMDGNIFHFHFDGLFYLGSSTIQGSADAYYDVVLGSGYMHFVQFFAVGDPIYSYIVLTPQSCSAVTIPYGETASVAEGAMSLFLD